MWTAVKKTSSNYILRGLKTRTSPAWNISFMSLLRPELASQRWKTVSLTPWEHSSSVFSVVATNSDTSLSLSSHLHHWDGAAVKRTTTSLYWWMSVWQAVAWATPAAAVAVALCVCCLVCRHQWACERRRHLYIQVLYSCNVALSVRGRTRGGACSPGCMVSRVPAVVVVWNSEIKMNQ